MDRVSPPVSGENHSIHVVHNNHSRNPVKHILGYLPDRKCLLWMIGLCITNPIQTNRVGQGLLTLSHQFSGWLRNCRQIPYKRENSSTEMLVVEIPETALDDNSTTNERPCQYISGSGDPELPVPYLAVTPCPPRWDSRHVITGRDNL